LEKQNADSAAFTARALSKTCHFARRAGNLSAALFDGLILGLASDATADQMTALYYLRSNQFQAAEFSRSGLFPWEVEAISRYFPPDGRILITSAGSGREAAALSDRYDVVTTECVPTLFELQKARLDGVGANRVRSHLLPADALPMDDGVRFDAAIVGWGAYSHLVGHDRRVRFLKLLKSRMLKGAPLLVSYLRAADHGRAERLRVAVANALSSRTDKHRIEAGDSLASGGFQRWFIRGEVAEEVALGGFEVVLTSEESYSHVVGTAC